MPKINERIIVRYDTIADENGTAIDVPVYETRTREMTPEEIELYCKPMDEKTLITNEIKEIDKWMDDNDYMIGKVMRGNWSKDDKRWLDYCEQYDIKKARKDELLDKLNRL